MHDKTNSLFVMLRWHGAGVCIGGKTLAKATSWLPWGGWVPAERRPLHAGRRLWYLEKVTLTLAQDRAARGKQGP